MNITIIFGLITHFRDLGSGWVSCLHFCLYEPTWKRFTLLQYSVHVGSQDTYVHPLKNQNSHGSSSKTINDAEWQLCELHCNKALFSTESQTTGRHLSPQTPILNIINCISDTFTHSILSYSSFSLIPQTYQRECRLLQNNVRTVKPEIYGIRVFVLFCDIHGTQFMPGTQEVWAGWTWSATRLVISLNIGQKVVPYSLLNSLCPTNSTSADCLFSQFLHSTI